MPTYQYRCQQCDGLTEAIQKFTDDALTECPQCDDGTLRKVYNAVGIVFKGSGFYATDNRSGGAKKAATTSTSDSTSEAKKSDAGSSSTASTTSTKPSAPSTGSTKSD